MKGNVTVSMLVGWGITLGIATVGGVMASISHADQKIDTVQIDVNNHTASIATLKAESDQYRRDIDSINSKLDRLLWANGINPGNIKSPTISAQ